MSEQTVGQTPVTATSEETPVRRYTAEAAEKEFLAMLEQTRKTGIVETPQEETTTDVGAYLLLSEDDVLAAVDTGIYSKEVALELEKQLPAPRQTLLELLA